MRDSFLKLLASKRAWWIAALSLLLLVGYVSRPFFKMVYLHYFNNSVEYAVEVLQSEEEGEQVRAEAASSLGSMFYKKTERANDALIAALKDKSPQVAASAAWSLGDTNGTKPEVVAALIEALDHEDGYVQHQAAYALGRIGTSPGGGVALRAIPKLREKLDDSNTMVRSEAASTLGELRDRGSIPRITKMLPSSEQGDRVCAVIALRHLQPLPQESVRGIEQLVDDEDEFVRRLARETLDEIRLWEATKKEQLAKTRQ